MTAFLSLLFLCWVFGGFCRLKSHRCASQRVFFKRILHQRGSRQPPDSSLRPAPVTAEGNSLIFPSFHSILMILTHSDVNIEGFSIFRTYMNQYIGEVVISAHNPFPAKAHYDFMRDNTEAVMYEACVSATFLSSCSYWWAKSKSSVWYVGKMIGLDEWNVFLCWFKLTVSVAYL